MKNIYAMLFLLLFIAPSAPAQKTVEAKSAKELRIVDDADVYQVYESVILALASNYKGQLPAEFIPVAQTTRPVPLPPQPSECIQPDTAEEHQLFDTALRDYEEQNKSRRVIKQDGFKAARLRVVPDLQDAGVSLSAVGFNSDKTAAVLYASFKCPGNCGTGGWMTFVRDGERWRPVRVGEAKCVVVN